MEIIVGRDDMKGISAMIATVLLIAFTVAVGGILSVWFTSFTRTSTASVENASVDQTKCSGTYIDIVLVDTNTTVIANRGSQTITGIVCYSGNGSSWGLGSLSPGASNATQGWNINGTGGSYAAGFGTVMSCSGKCLTIGVTGSCKSGDSCWKAS